LVRLLFVWTIRHPASGYVQGINDLAVPFVLVFLSSITGQDAVGGGDEEKSSSLCALAEALTEDQLLALEADCFWCLSKLLDGIQDHYTFAQPGIQKMVFQLKELIARIDVPPCFCLFSLALSSPE
jgi:hypothetical protein